jgi:Transposase DNA-binding/Transposase DDE domain
MSANVAWNPVRDLVHLRMADKRHARRVVAVARRALAAPRASFPRMMHDDSELEGAYRLFSNPGVSPGSILEAHYAATAKRALASQAPTIVVHDTTECCFGGESERDGIGRVSNDGKGLAIHVALALAPDGTPHGLLDVATHTRMHTAPAKEARRRLEPWLRESARWRKTADRVMRRLDDANQVVHVMDREADSYLLLENMVEAGRAFVIRVQHERVLGEAPYSLRAAIDQVEGRVEREVPLSGRSDRNRRVGAKKTHPARASRMAHLAIGARSVTIHCGGKNRPFVERPDLTLNIVRVWEPDPPADQPAVEWVLVTNLPIASPTQLESVVDVYRMRWTIEEYFKALKTGCAFEQRQLESRHALENALAILAPIACRLLLLRTLARIRHLAPATDVLTPTQVDVLRVLSARFKLPRNPSVRDALLAVAGLGGFLKRNGEPGWQTIGLGFEQLLQAELIWKAAKRSQRSDQS